jgi:hypothetical protein
LKNQPFFLTKNRKSIPNQLKIGVFSIWDFPKGAPKSSKIRPVLCTETYGFGDPPGLKEPAFLSILPCLGNEASLVTLDSAAHN